VLPVYSSPQDESETCTADWDVLNQWDSGSPSEFLTIPYIVTDSVLASDYFPFQQRGHCRTSDTPLCMFIEPTY